jgi:hypothetical protein
MPLHCNRYRKKEECKNSNLAEIAHHYDVTGLWLKRNHTLLMGCRARVDLHRIVSAYSNAL